MRNAACRHSCFLFICLLAFLHVQAQPACKIEHYSTEDGLSHGIVTYMFKDRDGFMWFGTWNGINRFDGRRFVAYKSSPGDLSHLTNDRIDQITEDDYNHLWIKAYDGRIYRFDKQTEQFLPLSAILKLPVDNNRSYKGILSTSKGCIWIESTNNGLLMVAEPQHDSSRYFAYHAGAQAAFRLPSNKINFFKEDKTGNIWVGTQQGLAWLVKDNKGVYSNNQINVTGNFISIAEGEGAMYFGTTDGRIISFNNKEKKFTTYQVSTAKINTLLVSRTGSKLYASSGNGELVITHLETFQTAPFVNDPSNPLHFIYEDRNGHLWIKPQKGGVVKFDINTLRFKTYRQKNNASYNYHGDHFKVYEDNLGVLWVNLKGGGFGYYNPATDEIEYFYNEPNTAARMYSNIVNSLYYDPTGILWLRTDERGIEKITFQRNEFHQQLLVNPGTYQSDNEVRGLCQDRKDRLWVGVKGGRLYVLQNGKPLDDLFVNTPPNGLGLVYNIIQDKNGAVWLGTKANGLYKAVPINAAETKYRLYHYQHNPSDPNSIGSNEIYSLLEDKAGRIWIGHFDNGLSMIGPGQDHRVFVHDNHALHNFPATRFRKIRHMALDKQDNLWLATTEGLLVINTAQPGKFSYAAYQKIPGNMHSLGNNDIQHIHRDATNNMWLSTSGGGLNKAIGDDPMKALQFQVYTTKQGLPNDYLLSCLEDNKHNLWVATQAGLAKLDPERKVFRNYNSYDGVPKFAFSEASGIRLRDGKLLFGTIKGYLAFDPNSIAEHPMQANMVFTNLQINNRNIAVGGKDKILQSTINHTGALTLQHDQNIISIDYAVLDYRSGDKQLYAYRLKGFDTAWHYNGIEHRATYTNLPPGNYVFEVKIDNKDLYSNVPVKSLNITILPPWWKTWWAYTIYVLVALITFEIIRRTSLTMLRLRHNIVLEKKLAALKLNFFTNVSHELRTPITLIINPIEEIYKQEQLSERGRQYMEVVRKNANRMSRFVNQLLELRKLQSGKAGLSISKTDMVSFIKSIATYFAELAREKKIDFRVESKSNEMEALIDLDKIETVIYNLVANAFKFTPEGRSIVIKVNKGDEPDSILLEVSDQGPGVPADKLDRIFELFYEGEDNHAKAGKGTGIGLALAKELIALHGGNIAAMNNSSGGLTVRVSLPARSDQAATAIAWAPEEQAIPGSSQLPIKEANEENNAGQSSPLILLVEDNTDLQFFLKSQLTAFYRVEVAGNGEEGWQKAQQLLPDLILSDIMMPKMDGIQMLDKLKTDLTTSHIPVILLTAKSAVESQIEGLEYGADYYITKPFQHDFLVAAIRNLIKQRKKVLKALLDGKKTFKLEPGEIQVTSQDEVFLKKVAAIVEEKMTDTDFDIDTIAETMTMSRTTFYKKFKSLTGLAPVEFVKEMRLQRAKQYMDTGYGNFSEIAYKVGFNNVRYFSTCFKNKFLMTPTEYVKRKNTEVPQSPPDLPSNG